MVQVLGPGVQDLELHSEQLLGPTLGANLKNSGTKNKRQERKKHLQVSVVKVTEKNGKNYTYVFSLNAHILLILIGLYTIQ